MKEPIFILTITDVEKRILVKALTTLKESQITKGKKYDFIDDLIVKTCDAPETKGKLKRIYEER